MTEEQKEKKRLRTRAWKIANRDKVRQYRKDYYKRYPEKRKEQKKKNALRTAHKKTIKKYGLTVDQYDIMLSQQNGLCAICGANDNRRLSVDHCHETGIIRGLLCRQCNVALGYFKDDALSLQRAFIYLTRPY